MFAIVRLPVARATAERITREVLQRSTSRLSGVPSVLMSMALPRQTNVFPVHPATHSGNSYSFI